MIQHGNISFRIAKHNVVPEGARGLSAEDHSTPLPVPNNILTQRSVCVVQQQHVGQIPDDGIFCVLSARIILKDEPRIPPILDSVSNDPWLRKIADGAARLLVSLNQVVLDGAAGIILHPDSVAGVVADFVSIKESLYKPVDFDPCGTVPQNLIILEDPPRFAKENDSTSIAFGDEVVPEVWLCHVSNTDASELRPNHLIANKHTGSSVVENNAASAAVVHNIVPHSGVRLVTSLNSVNVVAEDLV
mmetsp:Transcript_28659/g.58605  ORF Transcript_28659/g.58605 Transcript_28659/m.58605 type:complete len:246 (+) Transcript_28659:659-1396(+)